MYMCYLTVMFSISGDNIFGEPTYNFISSEEQIDEIKHVLSKFELGNNEPFSLLKEIFNGVGLGQIVKNFKAANYDQAMIGIRKYGYRKVLVYEGLFKDSTTIQLFKDPEKVNELMKEFRREGEEIC